MEFIIQLVAVSYCLCLVQLTDRHFIMRRKPEQDTKGANYLPLRDKI